MEQKVLGGWEGRHGARTGDAHAEHGGGVECACAIVGHVQVVGLVGVWAEAVGCGEDADGNGREEGGGGGGGGRGGGGRWGVADAEPVAAESGSDDGVGTGGGGTGWSRGACEGE
jgi:hypothetical protein